MAYRPKVKILSQKPNESYPEFESRLQKFLSDLPEMTFAIPSMFNGLFHCLVQWREEYESEEEKERKKWNEENSP